MGGLDFFCTTLELPEGELELLEMSMAAMNADPDPEAEDRKGCSGHVGKMIFSASAEQLAIITYVPESSASKVDAKAWMREVLSAVGGQVMMAPPEKAVSPEGGICIVGAIAADPEKGKYAIKDKDTAMAAAFSHLRAKGAFPEDEGDSDDEPCFGDDAFDNIDEL